MLQDNSYFPPFSRQEYARRHQLIRTAMKDKGLDCLIIFGGDHTRGNDLGAVNAVYVTNYVSTPVCYVVFPAQADPTMVIRFDLHLDNARDIAAIEDIRTGGFAIETGVGKRLQELDLDHGTIGLVGSGVTWPNYTIPHEHYEYLAKLLPQASFVNVSAWFEDLRHVKSEEELKVMERAGELTSAGYEEMILSTRPGARQTDLRRAVEIFAVRMGATYPLCHVGSTPMSNPHMHYPDPIPTHRLVNDGDVVMTELTVGIGSYSAKIMGTYFIGEPTRQYLDLFDVAASVYETAVAKLKPGMTGRDTKKFVEPVRAAGFTTHGPLVMGWATYNETPRVGVLDGSPGSQIEKQPDLDFVFKPGICIYVVGRAATQDLRAGVWVGASCVFTETGLKKLVKHPVSELRVV